LKLHTYTWIFKIFYVYKSNNNYPITNNTINDILVCFFGVQFSITPASGYIVDVCNMLGSEVSSSGTRNSI